LTEGQLSNRIILVIQQLLSTEHKPPLLFRLHRGEHTSSQTPEAEEKQKTKKRISQFVTNLDLLPLLHKISFHLKVCHRESFRMSAFLVIERRTNLNLLRFGGHRIFRSRGLH